MVRIAVNGALGRMGSRILHLAAQSSDLEIGAAFEDSKSDKIGKDVGSLLGVQAASQIWVSALSPEALKEIDVLIDFSSPQGAMLCLEAALKAKTRLVIGTTGLDSADVKKVTEASRKIAVLFSPNMSIGANFLFELARIAASKLKNGYDVEIVEMHHGLKKDAPSGTAKKIAEVIADERGWDLTKTARYGREGFMGERPREEIGIHAVRGGDIIGDHSVLFIGPGETIELRHQALSRDALARGALVAAEFLAKKPAGLYSMSDVLK